MKRALVTGSSGLIGSEAVRHFAASGWAVTGVDNNMRSYFFGKEASTHWVRDDLRSSLKNFSHVEADIRDLPKLDDVFRSGKIDLIIHTAAQPSHDWAAREPITDFSVNATGTLNLLELARKYCPEAPFIFTSTNKVYGDTPNRLPLIEQTTRWEIDAKHPFHERGIDESMSIDQTKHSLFGASKVAADILVQEYGRYFGMPTGVFRGGCLTGPRHSGAELHGFLAYLMKCAVTGRTYRIFGYHGKQVRDNIHCTDLVNAFEHYAAAPRPGEVYNIGGSRFSNCSMHEAIRLCEEITGRPMKTEYVETNRIGDHIWWISDISKFRSHYPAWQLTRNIRDILTESFHHNRARWEAETTAAT